MKGLWVEMLTLFLFHQMLPDFVILCLFLSLNLVYSFVSNHYLPHIPDNMFWAKNVSKIFNSLGIVYNLRYLAVIQSKFYIKVWKKNTKNTKLWPLH